MSTPFLGLNPLKEAQAVLDQYFEHAYPSDEETARPAESMLKEAIACALVSIADSLHRIVEEESQP